VRPADVAALTLSILAGLTALLSALAALLAAMRTHWSIESMGKALNGRLDQLLAEREARVRAEQAARLEQLRVQDLSTLGPESGRGVRIQQIPPEDDDRPRAGE